MGLKGRNVKLTIHCHLLSVISSSTAQLEKGNSIIVQDFEYSVAKLHLILLVIARAFISCRVKW
jgi:hypothetical protein